MSTTNSTTYRVGETYRVAPQALTIGTNVRTDTHPGASEFAASIKARGVLEPITVWVDDDGDLVVYRGQRRTLAAAKVGTPDGLVPVHVVPRPEETDRVIDQLVENIHRSPMRQAEERDAIEQLALLGVSAAQIVKRTAIARPTVDAVLTIAGSAATKARMDTDGLTLAQAAIFAEFEDDPAALESLEQAVSWGRPIEHTAQRLRDARAEAEAVRGEADRLRAQGLPVLDPAEVPERTWPLRLDGLVTADGEPVPEADWPDVPGAAVVVRAEWAYPDDDERRTRATSRSCGSSRCGSAPTPTRRACAPPTTGPPPPAVAAAAGTRSARRTAPISVARSSPTTRRGGRPRRSAASGWPSSSRGAASQPGPRP